MKAAAFSTPATPSTAAATRRGARARSRTLLVLLYLTGLRAGEGLRLTLADVDLETAVLRIRNTKFGKSRLVPVTADVAARLAHCRDTVTDELGERTPGEPFFPAPCRLNKGPSSPWANRRIGAGSIAVALSAQLVPVSL